jgi:hypothetical protein
MTTMTATLTIANTDPQVTKFIEGLKELLTDPANAADMIDVRARRLMLAMGDDGSVLLVRLTKHAHDELAREVMQKSGMDWTHIQN